MTPDVSVVICTRNRNKRIVPTLESVAANTYLQFEVIIVDQSNNEITRDAVKPFLTDPRFRYKKTSTVGLSKARNIGINEANGKIIAFTDDDCRVAEDWLEAVCQAFEQNPSVTAVFGRIIPGELTNGLKSGTIVDQVEAKRIQQVLPIAKKETLTQQLYKENRFDLGFGHGANMCFLKSSFSQFGEFDEFLGAGAVLGAWEDRDIGYRMLSEGGQILYSPEAIVYHDHWREWDEVKVSYKNYAIGTGTAVTKYMRSGDWGSIRLIFDWMAQLGIRQIASGIFKWQSWKKTYIGLTQLLYPWEGFIKGFKYSVDPEKKIYTKKKSDDMIFHQPSDELVDINKPLK